MFVDAITNILIQDRPVNQKEALLDAQRELSEFYGNLPVELRFQASNLQAYGAVHKGEGFVLLHVSFHSPGQWSQLTFVRSGSMREST